MSKAPRPGSSSSSTAKPKKQPRPSMPPPSTSSSSGSAGSFASNSHAAADAAHRTTSLMGKKRPRESDGDSGKARARRTKSTGDARDARDRESFQRGLIGVFVPRALQESLAGNKANLNDLIAYFLPTPTSPTVQLAPLLPLLRALTAHVSLIDPDVHGGLVSAIVALPWATGDERFVKSYVGWAGVLVSAHPAYAKEVVAMGVKGLAWQRKLPSPLPVTRRVFHARHHLLLSHLLSLLPTLPTILQPLLVRYFPHKREPEVAQATWVRNCCELIDYCPELGARVWSNIVDRMLRIDITNRVEDDETEDEEDEEAGPSRPSPTPSIDPFDLLVSQDVAAEEEEDDDEDDVDIEDLSSADGSDDEGKEDVPTADQALAAKTRKRTVLRDMRAKLDSMLCHFLRHLEEAMGAREHQSAPEYASQHFASLPGSGRSTPTSDRPLTPTQTSTPTAPSLNPRKPPSQEQSLAHFQALLNVFTRQILPTSSTQHIPFLLFLASSFSPAHTELFLGVLVSQALYATSTVAQAAAQPVSTTQRVAATVYIGSLVCRARYVSDDQARTVMTYLLAFIDGKLHQSRAGQARDELPLFYAVCQAAMLIFCFRWRAFGGAAASQDDGAIVGELDLDDADEAADEGRWMRDLDALQRALTSELNPLLGCNPTIVSTFAKVAHQTGFAYCFSIIEANQQLAHPRSTSSHSLAHLAQLHHESSTTPASSLPPRGPMSRAASTPTLPSNPSLTIPRQARQTIVDAGLDSYFPFDPYDLPRSAPFVEPLYRTWTEVAVAGGDDDDDDDDDSDESGSDSDSDSAMGNRLSTSRSLPKAAKIGSYSDARARLLRDGGLSSSLENMSISPNLSGLVGR